MGIQRMESGNSPAQDFQDPEATIEYDEGRGGRAAPKKVKIPKAVYRVGIILVAVIFGLVLWLNRSISPDIYLGWIKLQVMGTGMGEGFPCRLRAEM